LNDLPNATESFSRLFADDTCLLLSSPTLEELESQCNNELAKVSEWIVSNRLTLNPSKTQTLHVTYGKRLKSHFKFCLNNVPLDIMFNVKYLGVHLDYSLNFNHHVSVLEKKVSSALGVICKLKHFLPEKNVGDNLLCLGTSVSNLWYIKLGCSFQFSSKETASATKQMP